MAEGSLYEVDGRSAVQGMAGVGVAEPVGRNGGGEAGAACGLANNAQNREWA
jgi:hypothetical protein